MHARFVKTRLAVLAAVAFFALSGLAPAPAPALGGRVDGIEEVLGKIKIAANGDVDVAANDITCQFAVLQPFPNGTPKAVTAAAAIECTAAVPKLEVRVELWRRNTVLPAVIGSTPQRVSDSGWRTVYNRSSLTNSTTYSPCVPGDYRARGLGKLTAPSGYDPPTYSWDHWSEWVAVTCL